MSQETQRGDMAAEENLRSKALYKIELYLIKIIPMLIAGIYLTNTVLSYFYIDLPILSLIGGMSLLPLLFLYISSYVFRFCKYHRMFLHYIVANDMLNYADYYGKVPCSNRTYFLIHIIIAGLALYIILYMKFKDGPHKETNSKRAD